MNLPVEKLNRDEIYTFIAGLFVGLAWHLYFQQIGWVGKNQGVFDASLIFAWLLSTGVLYLLYMILQLAMDRIVKSKIARQDDEKELRKLDVTKYRTFFWAGPLEEQRLLLHIFGLLTVALVLVYYPIIAFISPKVSLSWLVAVVHFVLVVAACLKFYQTDHYLHQVNDFIAKGYCDTLDEAEYIRDRARLYADVQHRIYLAHLAAGENPRPVDQPSGSPTT
jgi:hypothetical protein